MEQMELNRHRFIFTAEEAARLPNDQPYIAYVCYYDWTDGDHSTPVSYTHLTLPTTERV